MKRIVLIASVVALGACQQQGASSDEGPASVDPLTVTGGLLITAPGGMQNLAVIRADGTDYETAGAIVTGKWEAKDGKVCIDPDAEGANADCYSFSNAGDDGSYTATGDSGGTVKVLQIDKDNAPGTAPAHQVGAYLLTEADGSQTIAIHSKDGTYHEAPFGGKATTRVDGDKRCFDPEGDAPESCSSAGDVYPDGAFTFITAEGGTGLVQPL